ncbi:MAG TPA: hypothetical protein VLF79_00400 [Candidatus Saccharimonadales bacterium]|nr:hypothetical protein [Candidatus Saccharimonadales bacterium]
MYSRRQIPGFLESESYAAVEANMLNRSQYSFTEQMARAVLSEPLAFFVTVNSAIPVADSIRGFYEEIDVEPPIIDSIKVPRSAFFSNISKYIEKKRMSRVLPETIGRIYVVDECVSRGATLNRAEDLLSEIGNYKVGKIRGKWYVHARRKDIDVDRVTSIHASKMQAIGRQAARLAFQ